MLLHEKVESITPLFKEHWPGGERTFRGAVWPSEWRGGLFQKADDPAKFKALFGREEDVIEAGLALRMAGITDNTVVRPGEGDPKQDWVCRWFQLIFDVPKEWL